LNADLVYVGSFNAGDESNLFFHNEYLNQSSWFGANKYTGLYYLKVDNGENVPRVAAAIDKMFENSDAPTKTLTEKQFQLQFMEMMGNVKFLINGISLIILFAVTLIVANTVAMSARERVTEIAVMRTLGFGRGHILGFILSEAVLMSLLGGLLGVLLAKFFFIPALVAAGNKTSISIWLINFRVTPETLLLAFAVSVGVGVLAGFVPAIRSSRSNIVDGLRQVV
jgi:putative ABC transport system permease protein